MFVYLNKKIYSMCFNKRSIINPYTGRSHVVDCGRCPSCQQKKANGRRRRIDATCKPGYKWYFLTLTYQNRHLPYVKISDLKNCKDDDELPIYRDYDVRFVRGDADYNVVDTDVRLNEPIGFLHLEKDFKEKYSFRGLRSAVGKGEAVAVCYYPDLQNFVKRLRVFLQRKHNLQKPIFFFGCTEYGPSTFRSHVHLLLHGPEEYEQVLSEGTSKCWRFDDNMRRKFEVAIHASSYVSTYVNRDADVPTFLYSKGFAPKHSYSQDFGMDLQTFDIRRIVSLANSNKLQYTLEVFVKGIPTKFDIPIPKYVINRHFPQFKGYSRLANSKVPDFVVSAIQDSKIKFYHKCNSIFHEFGITCYSHNYPVSELLDKSNLNSKLDDYHQVQVSLRNAFDRYKVFFPNASPYDFACMYRDVWQSYKRTLLRMFYENKDNIPLLQQYDNLSDLIKDEPFRVRNDSLMNALADEATRLGDWHKINFDPNKFDDNVRRSMLYEDMFYTKLKKRKVINCSMADIGFNV